MPTTRDRRAVLTRTVALLRLVYPKAERVPVQPDRCTVRLPDVQHDIRRVVRLRHRLFCVRIMTREPDVTPASWGGGLPSGTRLKVDRGQEARTRLDHQPLREPEPAVRPEHGDGHNVPVRCLPFTDVVVPGGMRSFNDDPGEHRYCLLTF